MDKVYLLIRHEENADEYYGKHASRVVLHGLKSLKRAREVCESLNKTSKEGESYDIEVVDILD